MFGHMEAGDGRKNLETVRCTQVEALLVGVLKRNEDLDPTFC